MLPGIHVQARMFGGNILANLTLAEAETILAGSKAKMVELGVKMSISVVDPRGDLITMCKMDGAPWRTPVVSRGKAVASASFEVASGSLTDNSRRPSSGLSWPWKAAISYPAKARCPSSGTGRSSARLAVAVERPKRTKTAPARESKPAGSQPPGNSRRIG